MNPAEILNRLERERWTAGVIGLGYVGLPLAVTAWQRGLDVIGFDISETVVERLNSGMSHIDDVDDDVLVKAVGEGVEFTADSRRITNADVVFICVPSPLGANRQPDLTHVESAARMVADNARPGQVINLETTSYPGTTEDYLVSALEGVGLEVDRDVFVAFSPERVSPGDEAAPGSIPKVVGGVSKTSGDLAAAAYRRLVDSVHQVSTTRVAEMSKLVENIYRSVNIGLINEIAQLSHALDIDVWEVIDAAATKPFGYQAFYPGPGVGGHCIPLDPQYLAWRAKEANFATRFIDVADQVNRDMPRYVTARITEQLNSAGKPVFGTKILGVGIAYKRNISDDRESASVAVLKELADRGAEISVYDPHAVPDQVRRHGFKPHRDEEGLGGYDLAVVLTDHDIIDFARVARDVPLIFDTRGVYRRLGVESDSVTRL